MICPHWNLDGSRMTWTNRDGIYFPIIYHQPIHILFLCLPTSHLSCTSSFRWQTRSKWQLFLWTTDHIKWDNTWTSRMGGYGQSWDQMSAGKRMVRMLKLAQSSVCYTMLHSHLGQLNKGFKADFNCSHPRVGRLYQTTCNNDFINDLG